MNNKHTFKKAAALFLGIALSVGATGCSFISTDNQADLEQTVATVDISSKLAKTEQYILSLLDNKEENPRKTNISAFLKHITTTLTKFQSSGISAVSERKETDKEIVLTITIPK